MTGARLKHYGWGREGEGMSAEERKFVLGRYRAKFATGEFDTIAVPGLDDLSLREPRVAPPASLAPFCTTDRYDRAAHTYGKSFSDYVRGLLGRYDNAPDVVAYPRNEAEVSAVVDWAGSVQAALTPFGGGSSAPSLWFSFSGAGGGVGATAGGISTFRGRSSMTFTSTVANCESSPATPETATRPLTLAPTPGVAIETVGGWTSALRWLLLKVIVLPATGWLSSSRRVAFSAGRSVY